MNQDSNNLNQNNFNEQSNNMANNQPLKNNQYTNNINQPLNNNVYQNQNYQQMPNNNQNIVSNNNNMPSKNKTPIIISIIILILIIGIGIFAGIKIVSLNNQTNNQTNNQKTSSNNSVNENLNNNNNVINNNQDNNVNNKNETNIKLVSAPGQKIYVDCPTSLRTKNKSRTVIMYDSISTLVGLTFQRVEEFEGNIEDVISSVNDDYVYGYSDGELDGSKIKVVNQEYIKVGNYNCIKFVGTAKNKDFEGNEWNCYVYGYAFIINDMPVAVIGIVSDESQDVNMIDKTRQNVDSIAATIRTEKIIER